jgi:hypothetical protein
MVQGKPPAEVERFTLDADDDTEIVNINKLGSM